MSQKHLAQINQIYQSWIIFFMGKLNVGGKLRSQNIRSFHKKIRNGAEKFFVSKPEEKAGNAIYQAFLIQILLRQQGRDLGRVKKVIRKG